MNALLTQMDDLRDIGVEIISTRRDEIVDGKLDGEDVIPRVIKLAEGIRRRRSASRLRRL